MKGYIPVEIPTKAYIKAYLQRELGERPIMTPRHHIGSKLYDLLHHTTNERRMEFAHKRYNTRVRILVNYRTFTHRGAYLNETNIKNFNLYVEDLIKDRFRFLMDTYIDMLPSFSANLPEVRRRLGIDVEEWDDDSMRKDYYRYRLAAGKPLLYNKTSARIVPSGDSAIVF